MGSVRVFVASRNAKKLAELERILGEVMAVELVGLDDVPAYPEPIEDGATFHDNALLKAQAGVAATGLPTIADDSGLCVDALNGMPGVLSARWSGDFEGGSRDDLNNRLLLAQLADVPDDRRSAHFAAALVCCLPDGRQLRAEGRMDGRIIRETRGTGGFGYDVVFVPDATADDRTSAELSAAEKDAISHRGQALRVLAPLVAAALGE